MVCSRWKEGKMRMCGSVGFFSHSEWTDRYQWGDTDVYVKALVRKRGKTVCAANADVHSHQVPIYHHVEIRKFLSYTYCYKYAGSLSRIFVLWNLLARRYVFFSYNTKIRKASKHKTGRKNKLSLLFKLKLIISFIVVMLK